MSTWGHRVVIGAFSEEPDWFVRTEGLFQRPTGRSDGVTGLRKGLSREKKWRNRGEETPLSIYGGGCKSRIGSRVLVDTFERVQRRRRHGGDKVGSAGADPSTGRSVRRGRALSAAILRTLGRGRR
ncbi:hypothetical protein FQA47_011278 [Oryzias melastigma]|uniref:Uncharacterized protein n=1 Tax=Oryzias melastigma TaxID=30732 RepID=A0A834FF03_ORYME|nr:hypothetical protein FQA47_011278 [Oryzias melastigma]